MAYELMTSPASRSSVAFTAEIDRRLAAHRTGAWSRRTARFAYR